MSTTFYPREDHPTDLIILTSDNVFFSVHTSVLLEKSTNKFGGLIASVDTQSITVPESSDSINLLLHAFYNYDPTNYIPTLAQISTMLSAVPKYGLAPDGLFARGTPFFNLTLNLALSSPLETFAVVCQHNLEELAVEVSHHLIAIPLHNLTDDLCARIGPIYLRRLVFLHLGRTERLKNLLRIPPAGHEPNQQCDKIDQKRNLEHLWIEATSSLAWDLNASTPVSLFHAVLSPLADKVSCVECKTSFKESIRKLIVDWTMVKTTI